jgi:HK97 family phage major capsid protein/HK97 family phage prohead protease
VASDSSVVEGTPMIERLETKASLTIDEAGTVTGVAWPFGSPDRVGDVIEKGAFSAPARLPMLFAHDQAQAIGVWESIIESEQGLTVKGRLLIDDVARAREVRALVREGAVTGLSIGFVTRKANARRGGGRTISALDLHEISIVPVPSHEGARITTAKSAITKGVGQMADENTGAAPEIAALETKMGEFAETIKGFAKFADRMDKMEAKLNRPAAGEIEAGNDNGGFERKAFNTFIRGGVERCSPDEVKALTVANDASAGYLAPESFGNEILKAIVQFSPIRQYAKVVTIGASSVKYPRRTASTAAVWVDEDDDRTASTPAYEQVAITPHELATYVDVSNALLEDNAYNLEGELSSDFGESFGKAEGSAFVNGTGDGDSKPKGFMAATGITTITTGAAAGFPASNPADVLIGMFHSLPGVHAQNGVWLMNRNTLGTVRKWKDGQGRYLVIDPISAGAPTTLLGRPIVEAVDMADIAADAFPIVFGDLQGYRIVDRISLSVLRDPFTLATKGQVRFHARRRVGGDVTNPDRFVKLKCAA